jgi:hypothetical protein
MDHAEAQERIADLALEPRRLIDLEADPSPEDRALLAHAQKCASCRAELDAWRRTHEAVYVGATLGDLRDVAPGDGLIEPPASLRVAVSAIPRRSPRLLDPDSARPATPIVASDRRRPGWWLPATAAVVVVGLVVGLGAFAVDRGRQADAARQQVSELVGLSASIDRLLQDAGHTTIRLVGLDGSPAGVATWSSGEIVVMTAALRPPGPGAEYRCWVERDGQRAPIGVMRFADGIAYWSGSLDRYDDLRLDGGGRLGVSLEAAGQGGGGAPVLVGELPG